MTMTVSTGGQHSTVTDVTVVEHALRQHHVDPTRLGKGFLRYWIDQGKSVEEILDIVGVRPLRREPNVWRTA